jgi:dephospho-CoA kinase
MVDTPRESRLQRALERGWTEAEFARREAAQWPVDQKRRAADVVIPNDGSVDELREAVGTFWKEHVNR